MAEETKRVGLVGHCMADSARLEGFIKTTLGGDSDVVRIMSDTDLREASCDLLLVNRVLDGRFSSPNGVSLIRQLRREGRDANAMLISNFPEAQAEAEQAGAEPGFGKRQIGSEEAGELLREACGVGA